MEVEKRNKTIHRFGIFQNITAAIAVAGLLGVGLAIIIAIWTDVLIGLKVLGTAITIYASATLLNKGTSLIINTLKRKA
jgi:hypothetical protein